MSNGLTNISNAYKTYDDLAFNGGRMTYDIGVRAIPEGYIGSVSIFGCEVYDTGQAFDTAEQAVEAARYVVLGAFARLLSP